MDEAVLDVEPPDLNEITRGRPVRGEELGDDSELARGVDCASAEEGRVSLTVRVVIASVLVTKTFVATISSRSGASGLLVDGADMWRIHRGHGVGFPDVHLATTTAVPPAPRVGVRRGSSPVYDVRLQ